MKEIRELTSDYQWRHCPGEFNPANLPSRSCSGCKLTEAETWWNGPNFLKYTEDQWPENPQPMSKDHEHAYTEVTKHPPSITHSLTGISSNPDSVINIEKMIDHQRFSTKTKLLQVTTRVLLIIKRT